MLNRKAPAMPPLACISVPVWYLLLVWKWVFGTSAALTALTIPASTWLPSQALILALSTFLPNWVSTVSIKMETARSPMTASISCMDWALNISLRTTSQQVPAILLLALMVRTSLLLPSILRSTSCKPLLSQGQLVYLFRSLSAARLVQPRSPQRRQPKPIIEKNAEEKATLLMPPHCHSNPPASTPSILPMPAEA